jgi:hypothetical protein
MPASAKSIALAMADLLMARIPGLHSTVGNFRWYTILRILTESDGGRPTRPGVCRASQAFDGPIGRAIALGHLDTRQRNGLELRPWRWRAGVMASTLSIRRSRMNSDGASAWSAKDVE